MEEGHATALGDGGGGGGGGGGGEGGEEGGRFGVSDWLLPDWLEDADAYDQDSSISMTVIGLTLAVNTCVAVACLLFFSWWRQKYPLVYTPKQLFLPEKTPPTLPATSLVSWLMPLLQMDEADVLRFSTFDAVICLRFYLLALRICLFFSPYAICVLLPINYTGDAYKSDSSDITSFDRWSMSNVSQGSTRLWAHVVGVYLLTFIIMAQLVVEYKHYARLRHEFLKRRHAHLRTILVEEIPRRMRSTINIATYFHALYPNAVLNVVVCQELRPIEKLIGQRLTVLTELERAIVKQERTGRVQHMRTGMCGEGDMVETVKYLSEMLEKLNDTIAREQVRFRRRARRIDREQAATTLEAIEELLQVTSIGSLERRLQSHIELQQQDTPRHTRTGYGSRLESESGVEAGAGAAAGAGAGAGTGDDDAPEDAPEEVQPRAAAGAAVAAVAAAVGQNAGVALDGDDESSDDDDDVDDDVSGAGYEQDEMMETIRRGSLMDRAQAQFGETPAWMNRLSVFWNSVSGTMFPDEEDARPSYLSADGTVDEQSSLIRDGASAATHQQSEGGPAHLESDTSAMTSKAFVTFKTFSAATIARQILHAARPGSMVVSECPEPQDIAWDNVYVSRKSQQYRRVVVESLVLLLMILYIAPVSIIALLVSEDALRTQYDWINTICKKSTLAESLVALVQPVCLLGLMALLPPILIQLCRMEGAIAMSWNQMRTFSRYFAFQVINVFLVTTIAGSIVDVIQEIVDDPSEAFKLLGESLPKVSGFFCDYIVIKAFSGLSIEIMRLTPFFQHFLKITLTPHATPRDRRAIVIGSIRALDNPGWFPYAKLLAQDMLVVVVVLTYGCIAPLTLLAGLLFFSMGYMVYKHQLLYVYEPIFELGGQFWPKIFRRYVFAMFVAQATMVGVLILKEGWHMVYAMVGLMLITYAYKVRMRKTFERVAADLPLDIATSLDLDQESASDELQGAELYLQPALRVEARSLPEVHLHTDSFQGVL